MKARISRPSRNESAAEEAVMYSGCEKPHAECDAFSENSTRRCSSSRARAFVRRPNIRLHVARTAASAVNHTEGTR